MDNSNSAMAKQVALAACDFEQQRTGNLPKSVTVVLSGDTVVMSRYVVKATALRTIPVRVSDSPLINYLKTGTLFHKVYGKLEFRIDLRILPDAGELRAGSAGGERTGSGAVGKGSAV